MKASCGGLPENLRAENLRQARDAKRLRVMIDAMGEKIALWAAWMSRDDVWDRVRAACGPGEFGALAERLGLDPAVATARDVFLEALSTVSTRAMAWDLVLRSSAGSDRETFLRIWRAEEEINALALRIFHAATYLYRGESVNETASVHDGTVGPALHRSFVSLSSGPLTAIKFAFEDQVEYAGTPVVLVIDARMARQAGAVPATYSLASDVLDLPRDEEGVSRTSPLGLAHEAQAHFPSRWPAGSGAVMVAIITALQPSPDELRRLEGTGLPMLGCLDIFPQAR